MCYSGFRKGQHPDRGEGARNPGDDEILEPPAPGEKIMLASSPSMTGDSFRDNVDRLIEAARAGERHDVLRLMSELIPGFGDGPGRSS